MGSNWEPLSEKIKHIKLKENHAILYPRLKALERAVAVTLETGYSSTASDKEMEIADEIIDNIIKSFNKTVDLGGGSE